MPVAPTEDEIYYDSCIRIQSAAAKESQSVHRILEGLIIDIPRTFNES